MTSTPPLPTPKVQTSLRLAWYRQVQGIGNHIAVPTRLRNDDYSRG